jgi:gliding motility-associated lipoprotein GldH
MKRTSFNLLIFASLIALLFACDRNRVFEAYEKLPQTGWDKDSVVVFTIDVTDTLQNQNLYVNVRNDIKYRYSNLWLFIKIEQPGKVAVADTFEVILADPTGKWLGEGFGGIKTRQVNYKSGVYFPVSGKYKINIRHGMRENILQGITDIGFRVEKQ